MYTTVFRSGGNHKNVVVSSVPPLSLLMRGLLVQNELSNAINLVYVICKATVAYAQALSFSSPAMFTVIAGYTLSLAITGIVSGLTPHQI